MTYKIGLTGLIGSGKSLAANYFASLDIKVIDTDAISHKITACDGVAIAHIIKEFGTNYISASGALDRAKMRELVFYNKMAKENLESILHPLIFDEVVCEVASSKSLYSIIVVPLLFKSRRYLDYVQRSIFVDCDLEILITRVMSRNNFSRDTVLRILENQVLKEEQLLLADDVIVNNSSPEYLQQQVNLLDKQYRIFLTGD
jgi:dephospho-CoA kinase